QSLTVSAGGSTTVAVENVTGLADGKYSVLIDSDQMISAVMRLRAQDLASDRMAAYAAVPAGATTLYAPSVYKQYYTFSNALFVMNTGTSNGTVSVTYKRSDGTTQTTETQQIAA